MNVLVTGCCGFIGFHTSASLLKKGETVIGVDNMNDYYSVELKRARKDELMKINGDFVFINESIENQKALSEIFSKYDIDLVINLAAQAGVRYSIEKPGTYIQSNIVGFFNILECCRNFGVKRLIYASSSSIYGKNKKVPFEETDITDSPVSLYAATKKSNELMAECYSGLYGFQCTGLRFFTVYGPWGRPDMAPILFANAISKGEPIKIFNNGDMVRDFTYIDDIVNGIMLVAYNQLEYEHKVYNIGCSNPVKLMDFIKCIEDNIGCDANKVFMPMQQGDVYITYADCSRLENDYGYRPKTSINDGVKKFIEWFKKYKHLL